MFNKKLKMKIEKLESDNEGLWNQLNDFSWKQQEAEAKEKALNKSVKAKELVISNLEEVIEAQGIIITAFADFIVKTTQPKKKGVKNGKKKW